MICNAGVGTVPWKKNICEIPCLYWLPCGQATWADHNPWWGHGSKSTCNVKSFTQETQPIVMDINVALFALGYVH